ncbi:MAG: acetate--CoA ligase family protein [Sedimentitalea sp.]
MRNLSRLLSPSSIAVIGGGAWCEAILGAAEQISFDGTIVPVHPQGKSIAGRRSVRDLSEIEGAIDAAFIGINRHATVDVVAQLRALGAGGAVCFASGFSEAVAEDETSADLQTALVACAGEMPVLGPNCYGFVNALDRAAIWPDQHGMGPVERGVAVLTQSSNIAINLSMQQRALPIAMMITCGNMAQTTQAELALHLLDDPRITAIGMHVEGFGDLRQWEVLAQKAQARGVPIVALKVGRSEQAQRATISHTASLAGQDAGAQALLERLGIARVSGLTAFLETLKLLHCCGSLTSRRIASISCSGGEASLIADLAVSRDLEFPNLSAGQHAALRTPLGSMVALSNPLDYHTYIWRDVRKMASAWGALTGDGLALTMSIVDYPTTDDSDWDCATQAALMAHQQTGAPFAVVSSLPELMPGATAQRLMEGGVVPLFGLEEALAAAEAAAFEPVSPQSPLVLPGVSDHPVITLSEAQAKRELAAFSMPVPRHVQAPVAADLARLAGDLQAPLVLKSVGDAHKSDTGGVNLNLAHGDLGRAAANMATTDVLIEEMIPGAVVELLVGVLRDPAHGYVLTLGAGGVLTEVMADTRCLLVPASRASVRRALEGLRIAPVLAGYRGKPGVDIEAVLAAIDALQDYVIAHADVVQEVEINPLICTPDRVCAADALIRRHLADDAH